jgi:hypothetical protein
VRNCKGVKVLAMIKELNGIGSGGLRKEIKVRTPYEALEYWYNLKPDLFIDKYQTSMPKLTQWAEDNIPEGLSIFGLEYSEHDKFIGIRTPQIRQVAKQYFKSLTFNEINELILK